jgi:hypothetical protein
MIKSLALVSIVSLLIGCATAPSDDFPLQYSSTSSRLVLAKDLPPLPGDGTYLAIPGYVFVAGHMSLHPGKHTIAYACPGDWEWRNIIHYIPWVEHNFELGKWYELYCEDGYPKVRQLDRTD